MVTCRKLMKMWRGCGAQQKFVLPEERISIKIRVSPGGVSIAKWPMLFCPQTLDIGRYLFCLNSEFFINYVWLRSTQFLKLKLCFRNPMHWRVFPQDFSKGRRTLPFRIPPVPFLKSINPPTNNLIACSCREP